MALVRLVLLVCGLVGIWFTVWEPLRQMEQHLPVSLSLKGIMLSFTLAGLALGMFYAPHWGEHAIDRNNLRPLDIVIFVVPMGVGFAVYCALQMHGASLGYQF